VELTARDENAWPGADTDAGPGARPLPTRRTALSDRPDAVLDEAPGRSVRRYRRRPLARLGRRLWAALRGMVVGRAVVGRPAGAPGGITESGDCMDGGPDGGPEGRLIHDLRTPLTSIRSFSEILRQHPELSHRQRARYLDIILTEGRRLEHVIRDFESQTGPDPAR